jgi:amino-acid N-acetyltransferase
VKTPAVGPMKAGELENVLALLKRLGLPVEGLAEHAGTALVARERGGTVVGSAALEVHGSEALLRSVAVDPAWQGSGLGRRLTEAALAMANRIGLSRVYLLTETAEKFFPKFGFRAVTRDEVPEAVRESVEFRLACPASAVAMEKRL